MVFIVKKYILWYKYNELYNNCERGVYMKRIIVSILIVLILIAGLFVLTGCGNNTNSNDSLENVTSNTENEITTTISCYNEGWKKRN